MSKLKSQLIQNEYKNKYFCDENHPLIWKGKLLLYDTSSCHKCNLPAKNGITIRWKCEKCNKIYCNKCFQIIVDSKCPINHKLKDECNFNNFSCDKCFGHFNVSFGVFYDQECNFTICLKCFNDALDIPEIIED